MSKPEPRLAELAGTRTRRWRSVIALLPPLDRAADGVAGWTLGLAAVKHRVERPTQPGGVLRRVLVVGVGRSFVRDRAAGVDDVYVGSRLGVPRPGRLLRRIVQVRKGPRIRIGGDLLAHRLERIAG